MAVEYDYEGCRLFLDKYNNEHILIVMIYFKSKYNRKIHREIFIHISKEKLSTNFMN